jgi:hypothetical protein
VPHPAGLPDLFIDRSLGRIQVPQLLRDAGLRLVTLAERYGIPNDEIARHRRHRNEPNHSYTCVVRGREFRTTIAMKRSTHGLHG